jgi:predicted nicotinamide N-methyase
VFIFGINFGKLFKLVIPHSIQNINLPAGPFMIYVPDNEAVKAMVEHKTNREPFPFWAKIWPAAIALSGFIQKNPDWVAGKQVAEFAAGLGLPSLVASAYAKQVWCSEISQQAMDIATKSGEVNGLSNIRFQSCDWNHLPPDFKAEVVLVSDVNYEPLVFDELEKVLIKLLLMGCTLLLASPQRLMAKPLFEKLSSFIANQFEEQVHELDRTVFISIFILKNHLHL